MGRNLSLDECHLPAPMSKRALLACQSAQHVQENLQCQNRKRFEHQVWWIAKNILFLMLWDQKTSQQNIKIFDMQINKCQRSQIFQFKQRPCEHRCTLKFKLFMMTRIIIQCSKILAHNYNKKFITTKSYLGLLALNKLTKLLIFLFFFFSIVIVSKIYRRPSNLAFRFWIGSLLGPYKNGLQYPSLYDPALWWKRR